MYVNSCSTLFYLSFLVMHCPSSFVCEKKFCSTFFFVQSPTVEGKRQGGPDNPSLTDNWDDAEGYYRFDNNDPKFSMNESF